MTAQELIDRIRDELDDYGDAEENTSAALLAPVDEHITILSVNNAGDFDVGDWLYAGHECMEVAEEPSVTDSQLVVRRGMRGSVAQSHSAGAVVRANLRFSDHRILKKLNASLAAAYPKLAKIIEDVSLVVSTGQLLYELPMTVREIRSVWLEERVGSGQFQLCRLAVPVKQGVFNLYGSYVPGVRIKVIAATHFAAMSAGSGLDTDFPVDDEAYEYLVTDTTARILMARAAQMALDDAQPARGVQQGQDQRYVLLNAAKAMKQEAKDHLNRAKMYLPAKVMPRPDARYFG